MKRFHPYLCLLLVFGIEAQTPKPKPKNPAPPATSDEEKFAKRAARLWSLQPLHQPEVPTTLTQSTNPIDAFIAETYQAKGLRPAPKADKPSLLRRVYFDLTGLPPSPADLEAFLNDNTPDAYNKVIDRLLASEQHGVRWARHWLDVLRYADQDGSMPASAGLYLWRDWMITALNNDIPYDDFVRAQLLGNRSKEHTTLTNTGYRVRVPGTLEDSFATGFLARAALTQEDKEQDLALNTVETVSTAFMGLTVGCAKCHDHKFDPIRQKDFYAMKALFDPLVIRNVPLATPADIFANGKTVQAYNAKKAPIDQAIASLSKPYKDRLYEERVASLPADAQAAIRKQTSLRTVAEQKIYDDYFPILRIDASKVKEVMTPEDKAQYTDLLKQQTALGRPPELPHYFTVEEDNARLKEPTYILTSGDPLKPEKDKPVEPGFPFKPATVDFREGRREGFTDWLTAPDNPLFARVAVNRIWAWHFGEGIQRTTSDFGVLGGTPSNQKLLDYLAAQFIAHNYSMKWLHRLIVTSDTYQLASKVSPELIAANQEADARNTYLWHFRLQRMEAESIWDSILTASGDLDLTVGGKSFQPSAEKPVTRRAAYMNRGYVSNADVMSNFLTSFDVDDGRTPCPIRTQTVTAPQALFTMNDDIIEQETEKFATRLIKETDGDLTAAVKLAYESTLARQPSAAELDKSLTVLNNDAAHMKDLSWLLFNLDEFIYVK